MDAHTHSHCGDLTSGLPRVENLAPTDVVPTCGLYSIGVHPWNTEQPDVFTDLAMVEEKAQLPQVVAVGECGLDALRGASLPVQLRVFEAQIQLAQRLGKPLIIHCVRCWGQLLSLRRGYPEAVWVAHGFRGKPQLARQMLDTGMYISLGAKFNPLTAAMIPADRLLLETDDAPAASLVDTLRAVACGREVDPAELQTQIQDNFRAVFQIKS